jgi:hypothetical protein
MITRIAKPDVLTPAFNQMRFIYDSTNKNKDGFKYIFTVYNAVGSSEIGQFKVIPDFPNGYGNIDIARIVQSYLSNSFDSAFPNTGLATDSYLKYFVEIGEEYIESYNYILTLTNSGGNVRINFTSPFTVGNQIFIDQNDGGSANPNLQGFFTVLSSGSGYIVVNSAWSDVTNANIDGTVRYANNQKTVVTDEITESDLVAFNGAMSFAGFTTYSSVDYLANQLNLDFYNRVIADGGTFEALQCLNQITGAGTIDFLTNQPLDGFCITPTQDLYFSLANNYITDGSILFTNSNGDELVYNLTNDDVLSMVNVGASANPSTVITGTAGLIKDDTEFYTFQFVNNDLVTEYSEVYNVCIDRRCKKNDYEILFLDRMGSFSSFAFQLATYERGTVTRDSYNRDIVGAVTDGKWGYNTTDYGYTNINTKVEKILELNTNWMSETMGQYFEELITSPVTYLKVNDEYFACLVQENAFEVFKQKNKNLIKQKITVKLANNNAING